MSIVIVKDRDFHQGYEVQTKDGILIGRINGNSPSNQVPIILLSVDPYVTFGLSHPHVISGILNDGPQNLITSRNLGHTLFEHGMKSSWGKVKVKNNKFITCLETFYLVKQQYKNFSVITEDDVVNCDIKVDDKVIRTYNTKLIRNGVYHEALKISDVHNRVALG